MSGPAHLAKRFFTSLDPRGPGPVDAVWAHSQLLSGEAQLWATMSRVDRRHAVGVARRVVEVLGEDAQRPVIAAALLHDVGKTASGLGTFARVTVTVVAAAVGHRRVGAWASRPHGWRRRAGLYVAHPAIGAGMLRRAGSDPLTVSWAAEHQSSTRSGAVPALVAEALRAADDD